MNWNFNAAKEQAEKEKAFHESLRQPPRQLKRRLPQVGLSLSKPSLRRQQQPDSSEHNQQWSSEDQALICKVKAYINNLGSTHNEPFYVKLLDEIARGPESPRAAAGELQKGLKLMMFLVNQAETSVETAPEKHSESVSCKWAPKTAWDAREQDLIDWYHLNRKTLPLGQFCLSSCEQVVNPDKFYAQLDIDIANGPMGPRARFGAIQDALEKLKNVVEVKEQKRV